jgi:hypothetical protein
MKLDRAKIIACAIVIEELQPFLPENMAYEVLDFGLHLAPQNLRGKLQEVIDACGSTYDTLLLGYGLCSLALVGLKSEHASLVTPKVDDCIAIFLGSRQSYNQQAKKAPGTYYLTKGWIEVGDSPFDEHERLVAQYGQARADKIMRTMLKHYTRLVYIDTGHSNNQPYIEYAEKTAGKFNLNFEILPGSNSLIKKMITGPWDDEFLVVPPGRAISYLDFKNEEKQPI